MLPACIGNVIQLKLGFKRSDQRHAMVIKQLQVVFNFRIHRFDDERLPRRLVKQHVDTDAGGCIKQLDGWHAWCLGCKPRTCHGRCNVRDLAGLCCHAARRPPLWFAESNHLRAPSDMDIKLVAGAVHVGAGWGLAGCCPGSALASLQT